MMKNILWFQDASNRGSANIYLNGVKIEPPTSDEYYTASKYIKDILNNDNSKIYSKGTIYKTIDGLLLNDHFDNEDEIGRKMGFLYFSNTHDPSEFIRRFYRESENLGMEYTNKNREELFKSLSPKVYNIKLAIAIGVIVTILTLYFIYKQL